MILHILKQEADASTQQIINQHKANNEVEVIELYKGNVDYNDLVKRIFQVDKVISW